MNSDNRKDVIKLIEKTIGYAYPLRWVDEKTSHGDFEGREFAMDVFRIPLAKQLEFLSQIRPIRDKIEELTGGNCLFIFHSPEATNKYYSHLFSVTKGIRISNSATIKIPFPDNGGTECKPEISGSAYLKLGEAA
ncbi:MAG: hypothetical protein Q8P48_05500 [Deltaproteobacteria bacterium]|nr:hypothetical protein [Deltaproteobacteria bacterium]